LDSIFDSRIEPIELQFEMSVACLNPSIQNPKSQIQNLFDDAIRPRQHVRWNRQTDLLGGFQIDHELEFRRLLDRKISGLCAFENLIDVIWDSNFVGGEDSASCGAF
jgi:hypothetical protein